jgi:hypothetical protein
MFSKNQKKSRSPISFLRYSVLLIEKTAHISEIAKKKKEYRGIRNGGSEIREILMASRLPRREQVSEAVNLQLASIMAEKSL